MAKRATKKSLPPRPVAWALIPVLHQSTRPSLIPLARVSETTRDYGDGPFHAAFDTNGMAVAIAPKYLKRSEALMKAAARRMINREITALMKIRSEYE